METYFEQLNKLQSTNIKTEVNDDDETHGDETAEPPLALSASMVPRDMSDMVDKMEEKFKATEAGIQELSSRVESEFSIMIEKDDDLKNPTKVLKRLQEAKSELASVKDEIAEMRKFQKDSLEALKAEFDNLNSALSGMHHQVLPDQVADEKSIERDQKLSSRLEDLTAKPQPPSSTT